jgi:hypothetical protein
MNKEETTAFWVMMGFYYKAGVYNKTDIYLQKRYHTKTFEFEQNF